jgi:hypothetical protein
MAPHPQAEALRSIFGELGVDQSQTEAAINKSSDARYETLLLATNYESEDPLLSALADANHEPISMPMGAETKRLLETRGGMRWVMTQAEVDAVAARAARRAACLDMFKAYYGLPTSAPPAALPTASQLASKQRPLGGGNPSPDTGAAHSVLSAAPKQAASLVSHGAPGSAAAPPQSSGLKKVAPAVAPAVSTNLADGAAPSVSVASQQAASLGRYALEPPAAAPPISSGLKKISREVAPAVKPPPPKPPPAKSPPPTSPTAKSPPPTSPTAKSPPVPSKASAAKGRQQRAPSKASAAAKSERSRYAPAAAKATAGNKKTSPRKKIAALAKPPSFDPSKPPPKQMPKRPIQPPEVNEEGEPFWKGLSAMVQVVRPTGAAAGSGAGAAAVSAPGAATGGGGGGGSVAATGAALLSSPIPSHHTLARAVAMPAFPDPFDSGEVYVGSNQYGEAHNMLLRSARG